MTNQFGREVSLFVDTNLLALSVHATNRCSQCHADVTSDHPDDEVALKPVNCDQCHHLQTVSYGASVHGVAKREGQDGAALCTDCHGTHNILHPTVIESPLHWSKLSETCGECHPEAAADVQASVHGRAVAKGHRESATCTDCHSEHSIQKLKGASPIKLAGEVCGKCHASERINTKYRLPGNRVSTFLDSYHGLAVQSGYARAANCASCHGVHKILPSKDPDSMIHPSNLAKTCGECHPGANENFITTKVHLDVEAHDDFGTTVNWWARRIYLFLIVTVVGGLALHNLLSWIRKLVVAYRTGDRSVVRMNRNQRLQHSLLAISFVILALSGFALKYPDSWLAWMFGADEAIRRWVHRLSGVVLLGVGAWHLVYIFITPEGRLLVRDMLPRWRDAQDLWANLRRLATGKGQQPQFARFGYAEKLEYWAVVWGTIIMGVTGLMLWMKMGVTRWLPGWAVDVATTIHYYEAILACLAIVVWHFYHVIFDPHVYPMNWAWLDGRVSAHWQAEEHPLDRSSGQPAAAPKAEARGLSGSPKGVSSA